MSRICLLTDSDQPSGVGAHLLTLAAGLVGEEITVAGRPATGLIDQAAVAGFAIKQIDDDEDALAKWFRRTAPDLVHVHAGIGWEGHHAVRAATAANIPVVRTEHLPYLLTDPAQRAEHRDVLRGVARLICVSEAVAQSHRDAGIDAALIVTVRNGVTARAPSHPRATVRATLQLGEAPVLLMVARFTEQKNHRLLLDALPAILSAHPDCVVLLVGDGPLAIPVARAVASGGLATSVRLLGMRDDVPDLMSAADLLVLPSTFEGLPLVALEAMGAGLPIVASDAPGNAEAIDHGITGRLVGPGASFADAVIEMLADRDRLVRMATAGMDQQRRLFSSDRMVAETRAVYATALPRVDPTSS